MISTEGAADFAAALGLQRSEDPDSADLIALCGSQADRIGLEAYEQMLAPAAARKTPCLCINPDKWMLTPTGRAPGAGAIAERYQALGGEVVWIGKPYLPIYQYAQRKLGVADPARVLCVGDSVEHDIVGARGFGAAAALMLTGILAELSEARIAARICPLWRQRRPRHRRFYPVIDGRAVTSWRPARKPAAFP